MLYTICSVCGAKHPINVPCNCKKDRDRAYDRGDRQRAEIYQSRTWKKLTKLCKMKCNGIDLYQYYVNNKIVKGSLSHHIIPVEDDPGRAYDLSNLIWVSHKTHAYIHSSYDKSEAAKKSLIILLENIKSRWAEGESEKF